MAIPLNKRAAFFDKSCGADENLRREVISLLSFEENSDDLPAALVAEMFASTDQLIDLTDQKIGHYKM